MHSAKPSIHPKAYFPACQTRSFSSSSVISSKNSWIWFAGLMMATNNINETFESHLIISVINWYKHKLFYHCNCTYWFGVSLSGYRGKTGSPICSIKSSLIQIVDQHAWIADSDWTQPISMCSCPNPTGRHDSRSCDAKFSTFNLRSFRRELSNAAIQY
jgi:hypothetical protein